VFHGMVMLTAMVASMTQICWLYYLLLGKHVLSAQVVQKT